MPSAAEVGKKLVELMKTQNGVDAVDALYADNAVSIEAMAMGTESPRTEGKAAIRARNIWWAETHTQHKMVIEGPWPHGDQFIVTYEIDVTAKAGPMQGQRIAMKEAALYTVRDGKIAKAEFFFGPG